MIATLWLTVLLGCWERQEHRIEVREEKIDAAMGSHRQQGDVLRDAAFAGDVASMRAAAEALAQQIPVEALPPAARPHEVAMGVAVGQIRSASDPGEASAGVARLARSCGACHEAVGQRLPPPALDPPPDGSDVAAKMKRHRWAVERMWDGLVGPSEEAFAAGVTVLASALLVPSGTAADSPLPPLATELAVQAQDQAALAGRTSVPTDRARLFGELLGTCAACHALLAAGPDEPAIDVKSEAPATP